MKKDANLRKDISYAILMLGFAICLVVAGVAVAAEFDCPWTATSGTVPSEGGPSGGGDYGGNASGGP